MGENNVKEIHEVHEQIERNKRLLAAKQAMNGRPAPPQIVDADSIKGVEVDDSEIGDGKALTYSGSKGVIVYKRAGGGGGGGGHVWTDAEWLAYQAMALVVAGLLHVVLYTLTMPSNTMSAVLNHATGSVPLAVVCAPVGDINGRCWYDPATLDANNVTIWVSNPPGPNSTFTIVVLVYH